MCPHAAARWIGVRPLQSRTRKLALCWSKASTHSSWPVTAWGQKSDFYERRHKEKDDFVDLKCAHSIQCSVYCVKRVTSAYSSMQGCPAPLVFGFYIGSLVKQRIYTICVCTQDWQHQRGSRKQQIIILANIFELKRKIHFFTYCPLPSWMSTALWRSAFPISKRKHSEWPFIAAGKDRWVALYCLDAKFHT